MKGFVPIDIPTKPYVKAYITHRLGNPAVITTENSTLGRKIYDLLEHKTNERADQFKSKHYTEKVRLYIPVRLWRRRGCFLNATNIKNFNLFAEEELKFRFHSIMDDLIFILPNFLSNLPEVRRRLGVDIESWSDDSMKKSYYRYRVGNNNVFYLDKYNLREKKVLP
jgi:hypothetical protein